LRSVYKLMIDKITKVRGHLAQVLLLLTTLQWDCLYVNRRQMSMNIACRKTIQTLFFVFSFYCDITFYSHNIKLIMFYDK